VELELRATHEMFGLPYIIFRPHNVYGEHQNIGDRYRNVIGIFMNQILRAAERGLRRDRDRAQPAAELGAGGRAEALRSGGDKTRVDNGTRGRYNGHAENQSMGSNTKIKYTVQV